MKIIRFNFKDKYMGMDDTIIDFINKLQLNDLLICGKNIAIIKSFGRGNNGVKIIVATISLIKSIDGIIGYTKNLFVDNIVYLEEKCNKYYYRLSLKDNYYDIYINNVNFAARPTEREMDILMEQLPMNALL